MPLVTLFGIPAGTDTRDLQKLIPQIQFWIGSTEGINIDSADVDVQPFRNQVSTGGRGRITIIICDFDKKNRSSSASMREAARRVGLGTKKFFNNIKVRVCMHPMDQELCWSSDDEAE